MGYEELISAQYGTIVVNDTTEKVIDCQAIYVAEDTVFARIEVDGDTGTDVKGDYITTPGTAVKAGVLLTPLEGTDQYFSAVTLTSGSVVLLLADN